MTDGFGPEQPPGAALVWGLDDPLTDLLRSAPDGADRNVGPQPGVPASAATDNSLTPDRGKPDEPTN